MSAPDKIYFDGTSSACKQPLFSSRNIEYIRKDYLLEWAKEQFEMYVRIAEQGSNDIDFGRMNAFSMLINKLNEL